MRDYGVAAIRRLQMIEAERDRYRAELESIADADPVDLALDPTWAQRVAREAITGQRVRS